MGYRIRLGKVSKKEKQRFKGLNHEQAVIENGGENNSLYYPPFHTQLYEIGKYVAFEKGRTAFYDFDIVDATEAEFDVLDKEGLAFVIESYRKSTLDFYIKILKPFENYAKLAEPHAKLDNKNLPDTEHICRVLANIQGKIDIWQSQFSKPYYLDEEKTDGEIVSSWSIEYAIFNLVHIYRTFDWKNDYLIYSGW